jgi:hypothetical protein
LATETKPPEPLLVDADPLVATCEEMVTFWPTTAWPANEATAVGEMVVTALGLRTLTPPPPPPRADEEVTPFPGGGDAVRSDVPSGESSLLLPRLPVSCR